MNPITQQFMMGAAGAGDTYWMTTVSYSTLNNSYNNSGRQFDVNSAGNVIVAGVGSSTATIFEMSDKAVVNWTTTRATTANYSLVNRYSQAIYNADGSIFFGGGVYDFNVGNYFAGFASVSSSGTYSTQRRRSSGGTLGISQDFVQLSDGNIVYKTYGTTQFALVSSSVGSWGNYASQFSSNGGLNTFYAGGGQIFDDPGSGFVNVIGNAYINSLGYAPLAFFSLSNSLGKNTIYYYRYTGVDVQYPLTMRSTANGYYLLWGVDYASKTLYLTYVDSSYAFQWTRYWNQSPNVSAYDDGPKMAVDSSGNVYVIFYSNAGLTQVDIFKYNSSGSIVWKNRISGITVSGAIGRPKVVKNALYFAVGSRNLFKIPIDGTKTGTYGPYTYTTSSISDNTGPTLVQGSFFPSDAQTTGSSGSVATDFTSSSNTVTTTQYAL